MVNLKLKKSLVKENYVNQLVIKGSCQVREVVNYENQKTNPQLIQDLMTFIENEIAESKYTKKDSDFDKPKILEDILISVCSYLYVYVCMYMQVCMYPSIYVTVYMCMYIPYM